jgi:hypothetical protein
VSSGHDLSAKVPYSLMKGRLGVYEKEPFDAEGGEIDGVHHQHTRMQANGGNL